MRTSSKICCLYRLHAGTTLKATLISRQQSAVAFIHRNFSQSRTVSQVQKEKSEEASSDLDVRREKPYEHLSFSQKGIKVSVPLCSLPLNLVYHTIAYQQRNYCQQFGVARGLRVFHCDANTLADLITIKSVYKNHYFYLFISF